MFDALAAAYHELCERRDLSASEMRIIVSAMMRGELSEVEIAAFLTGLRVKGEAVDEIVGAAQALMDHATPITVRRQGLLDTCGTGGDELRTFNISTAAAFVLASLGVPIPKHGNRGVSSTSGSADVLEALGVNLQLTPEQVSRCVDELGIGFCFAPLLHGAMKYASPVRKQLRFRTIFNLLGPLVNPARAEYQLVGTSRPETAAKLAQALARLGRRHALVVCGAGQLDEVSLWGETCVFEVTGNQVAERTLSAASFGLNECRVEELQVDSAAQSAEVLRSVFSGARGPARDIVIANAAAGLMACERVSDPREAAAQVAAALDSGGAERLLGKLMQMSHSASAP